MNNEGRITIRDLYPGLSEAELKAAEENLDRYLELIVRIHERMEFERSNSESTRGLDQEFSAVYDETNKGRILTPTNKINFV
jgi:hypothetical protein